MCVSVCTYHHGKGKLCDVGLGMLLRAQNMQMCVERFHIKLEWQFKCVKALVKSLSLLLHKLSFYCLILTALPWNFLYRIIIIFFLK